MIGWVLLSEEFGAFLEMSDVNLEPELSQSTGVSVTISQFGLDLTKLVNVFEDVKDVLLRCFNIDWCIYIYYGGRFNCQLNFERFLDYIRSYAILNVIVNAMNVWAFFWV